MYDTQDILEYECVSHARVCFVGVDVSSMHTMKKQRPSTMLSDVRQLVATGGSLNQPNDDRVTLVSEDQMC